LQRVHSAHRLVRRCAFCQCVRNAEQTLVNKISTESLALGLGSLASAAAYVMLYLWAFVFVGFSNTSTILSLWASVGIVTCGITSIIALADKGLGPFAGLHAGRSEQHKETLQGTFIFNAAFMLAVLWELAMELSFHQLAPKIHPAKLARLIFIIVLITICLALQFGIPVK